MCRLCFRWLARRLAAQIENFLPLLKECLSLKSRFENVHYQASMRQYSENSSTQRGAMLTAVVQLLRAQDKRVKFVICRDGELGIFLGADARGLINVILLSGSTKTKLRLC